jgi:hypothetical protein
VDIEPAAEQNCSKVAPFKEQGQSVSLQCLNAAQLASLGGEDASSSVLVQSAAVIIQRRLVTVPPVWITWKFE